MLKISNPVECCGCFACANICPKKCIVMKEDEEGFCYPHIDQNSCIKCGLCETVCPILQMKKENVRDYPIAYASFNKKDEERISSSSGGIFPLLAEVILDQGGVVFGAAFTDDVQSVKHISIEKKEDLYRLLGSKYLQSIIGDAYDLVQNFLNQGRKVLFTGTPCQVEGLKSFLRKEYADLFCMDIICHGVPSPKVWEKYVFYQEKKMGAPMKEAYFRNKKYGWKNFAISLEFSNGRIYRKPHAKDLYMQAFLRNISLRPSCYQCHFKKVNRVSDITVADFWGISRIKPKLDDDKGISLILLHSEKGKGLFNEIQENLVYDVVDMPMSIKYNTAMLYSVEMHPKRTEFFENLEKMPFNHLVTKYINIFSNMKALLKSLVNKRR